MPVNPRFSGVPLGTPDNRSPSLATPNFTRGVLCFAAVRQPSGVRSGQRRAPDKPSFFARPRPEDFCTACNHRNSCYNKPRIATLLGLIFTISLFRLLPHPPNFTPILAVALFAGAQFTDRRLAFVIPLAAMLVADLLLGMHATLPFVYGSIALLVLLGGTLRDRMGVTRVAATTLFGSVLFFIVTNFGAWLMLPEFYTRDPAGLLAAYIAALPFFQNAVLGDFVYVAILFVCFNGLQRRYPELVAQSANQPR